VDDKRSFFAQSGIRLDIRTDLSEKVTTVDIACPRIIIRQQLDTFSDPGNVKYFVLVPESLVHPIAYVLVEEYGAE